MSNATGATDATDETAAKRTYTLLYDASSQGDGSRMVEWTRTLEELLTPNGSEPLLIWMLREIDRTGGFIRLESVD